MTEPPSGYDYFLRDITLTGPYPVQEDNNARIGSSNGQAMYNGMPSVAADGTLAFVTPLERDPADTDGQLDVYVRKLDENPDQWHELISGGGTVTHYPSEWPSISRDGTRVAFQSHEEIDPCLRPYPDYLEDPAENCDRNGRYLDIYLRDTFYGFTTILTLMEADDGAYFPVISGDGNHVVFQSYQWDVVPGEPKTDFSAWDIIVCDVVPNLTSPPPDGTPPCEKMVRISNKKADHTPVVGCNSHNPTISHDGRYVAFQTACDLTGTRPAGYPSFAYDVYVVDRDFNNDGAFDQYDQPGGVKVYRFGISAWPDLDYPTFTPQLQRPHLSDDGRYLAFESTVRGEDLFPSSQIVDTNGSSDIFLYDFETGQMNLVSRSHHPGEESNGTSWGARVLSEGPTVYFNSDAMNMTDYATAGFGQIYRHEGFSAPPTGTVSINGGAAYTPGTQVTLALSATDSDPGDSVVQMKFSNVDDSDHWSLAVPQPYAETATWTLAAGDDGERTVYVKFQDFHGSWSAPSIADTIVLDTAGPVASITAPVCATDTSTTATFTVGWSALDALSGVASYDVDYRLWSTPSFTPWLTGSTATSGPFTGTAGQSYYFRARSQDVLANMGDWTAERPVVVPYDQSAGTFSGNWSTSSSADLYLGSSRYATSQNASMTYSFTDATEVSLIVTKRSNGGYARIYLDSTLIATVSLYSPTTAYRQRVSVQTFGMPTSGQLRVSPSNTKPPGSSGTRVEIDGIAVMR